MIYDTMFSMIIKMLLSYRSAGELTASSPSQKKTEVQASELQTPFPFLSLPLELRLKVYELLLCRSRTIDLLYRWNYLYGPRLRFMQQERCEEWIDSNILLSNKQIHTEASDVLYNHETLHLRCDQSLRMPFPEWPLRGIGKPMRYPNKDGDKLSPKVLRRFKSVRLSVFVAASHNTELDSRTIYYYGSYYGYTPFETEAGLKGLKAALGALSAVEVDDNERKLSRSKEEKLARLYLDLELPTNIKRCTAGEFEEHWMKEGIWDVLRQVTKVRDIEFGGSAYDGFGRPQWI